MAFLLSPVMKAKRRRKKPQPTTPSQPPRINLSSSPLSLREQLHLAKTAAAASVPTRPLERTKFRRKKTAPRIPPPDHPLPDGKYARAPDPLLLIDGYNVVGAWPLLRKLRDAADMDAARQLLIAHVAEFAHVRGWDCVLVFDAQRTHAEEKPERCGAVSVVYTGTETADSYIERAVYQTCEEDTRQVWAATSDVAQLSFSRSKGAHIMSSKLFIQELKRAKKETREKLDEHDPEALRGNMLIANVDETTRDRLYRLRDGKL